MQPTHRPTDRRGEERAARRRLREFEAFLRSESAGGAALILASLVGFVLANSAAAPLWQAVIHFPLGVSLGGVAHAWPVEVIVNDGLMAVFFLVVGLEIRREMEEGALSDWRSAAAPGLAALGGMVVPALIYVALNVQNPAALRGWGVPVATDIAFSLAVLRSLGRRAPLGLAIFLSALAIIDDLGAILVIAAFYTENLDLLALAGAVLAALAMLTLRGLGVRRVAPYAVLGVLCWAALSASGVHGTLAGVVTAFCVPRRVRGAASGSVAERMEHGLAGFVALVVLPLFGFCNAGVDVGAIPEGILHDPMVLGILLGLVLGKQVGVFGVTSLASRIGLVRLPADVTLPRLYGASVLCGIGFTMSLFIGNLAFAGGPGVVGMKLAVFAASLICAAWGVLALLLTGKAAR